MQESKNCKKELNYADAQDVPIVPVMCYKGFKATGWLGIITAGMLWIDFRYVSLLKHSAYVIFIVRTVKHNDPTQNSEAARHLKHMYF